jgi:hypothetical protein
MENMNMKVEGKKFLPPKESKVLGGTWDAEKRQCTVQNGDIKTTYSFVGKPNVSGEMFVSTMHYNKDGAAVVLDQKTGKWRNMNFVDKYKAGIDTKSTVGTVKAYKGERKQGDMLVMYSAADLNLKKFDRPMIRFGEKIASAMPIKIK